LGKVRGGVEISVIVIVMGEKSLAVAVGISTAEALDILSIGQ
jgi:hypothetical protein